MDSRDASREEAMSRLPNTNGDGQMDMGISDKKAREMLNSMAYFDNYCITTPLLAKMYYSFTICQEIFCFLCLVSLSSHNRSELRTIIVPFHSSETEVQGW